MAAPAHRVSRCQRSSDFRLAGLSPRGSPVNLALPSMRDAWAVVRPWVFIIGGLAAAHCAVIFWPPLPRLTIHRAPDDTVPARASVTGYSNPGGDRRPLIMGSLHPPRSWCPFHFRIGHTHADLSGTASSSSWQVGLKPGVPLEEERGECTRGGRGGDKFGRMKMRTW